MIGQEELNLKDYLNVIIKNKKLIIWGTLICILAAALLSLVLPRVYQTQLILEVGKIYLPPAKDKPTQEVEFIEEPDTTAEIVKSEAILSRVRREMKLEIPLERMRKNLEVITFPEERGSIKMGSPLVELIYRGNHPLTTVKVLDLLASIISEEHQKKYQDNVNALENRVANSQGKITGMQKVVDRQFKLREEIKEQIGALSRKATDFDKKIDQQESSKMTQVEAFFIDSYASNQERIVSTMNDALAELDTSIAENQEKIGDFKDEIANLTNLVSLCQNTRIRSQAITPEKPISPKYSLNIFIGGLIGLIATVGIAFFREYTR